jgi:hypothetical protein
VSARYEILRSCVIELERAQVIPSMDAPLLPWYALERTPHGEDKILQSPREPQEMEMSIESATKPLLHVAENPPNCSEMLR